VALNMRAAPLTCAGTFMSGPFRGQNIESHFRVEGSLAAPSAR
jgi:hypothetical protein